jgi:V/A-type H+-transporting ATPase subunit A
MLQKEESLREVAEIVGAEGLQDMDRLLMHVAEMIRSEFLCQNSFTDDAFSAPEKTLASMKKIRAFHDQAASALVQGISLEEAFRREYEAL